MAFLDRLFGRTYDYDDYEDDPQQDVEAEDEELAPPLAVSRTRKQSQRVVDIRAGRQATTAHEVVILTPPDSDMTWQICDYVRDGKTVVCNIENILPEERQRFVDFIRGAAYALDGVIRPLSKLIFIFAPRTTQVTIPELEEEQPDEETTPVRDYAYERSGAYRNEAYMRRVHQVSRQN